MDVSNNDLVSVAPIIGADAAHGNNPQWINIGSGSLSWIGQLCRIDRQDGSGSPSEVRWITGVQISPPTMNLILDKPLNWPVPTGTNPDNGSEFANQAQAVLTIREERRS